MRSTAYGSTVCPLRIVDDFHLIDRKNLRMSYPRLTFHGAAHGVTGSYFETETENSRILINCGMFQGPKSERALSS